MSQITVPPWALPALITFLLAQIPVILLLLRPWFAKRTPEQRALLLGAVKGAKDVLSKVAPITPTNIDDVVLDALKQIEAELGPLSPQLKKAATNQFVSLVARDADDPQLAARAAEIARRPAA